MLERFFVNTDPIIWLTIFVLAIFVGVEVISKVSSTLHTPLMSGANAIHGVILVGAILVAGSAHIDADSRAGPGCGDLGIDQYGRRFVVTDRMLVMFSRPKRALDKSAHRELEQ
jgi:NAD(P) transhydrogenase subunit alpha